MSFITIGIILVALIFSSIKILAEYERAVIFRLGRCVGAYGPGLVILIPFVDKMIKVQMRTITMDIQPQDIITKDNVSVQVNAVVYFRVMDPQRAVLEIEDFYFATSQLAQTTLRSVVGQVELDELLASRDKINHKLQEILDTQTEPWGIKVSMVEVKQIDLPEQMKKAMAKEAESERERRAKVISAEGELQRSEKLMLASKKLSESPSALQLAYLQTIQEMNGNKTNTIIFPFPLDVVQPFVEMLKKQTENS
ncbi:MAG: slipin family protein [Bdellovibrionales bacterium]